MVEREWNDWHETSKIVVFFSLLCGLAQHFLKIFIQPTQRTNWQDLLFADFHLWWCNGRIGQPLLVIKWHWPSWQARFLLIYLIVIYKIAQIAEIRFGWWWRWQWWKATGEIRHGYLVGEFVLQTPIKRFGTGCAIIHFVIRKSFFLNLWLGENHCIVLSSEIYLWHGFHFHLRTTGILLYLRWRCKYVLDVTKSRFFCGVAIFAHGWCCCKRMKVFWT